MTKETVRPGAGLVTTDVVTFGGGGPEIVVADDLPVPDTMITFGVGGEDLACEEPRELGDFNNSGTAV